MTNTNKSHHYSQDIPEVTDIDVETGFALRCPRQQCVAEQQRKKCSNINPLSFIAGDDCGEAGMPAAVQPDIGNKADSTSTEDKFSYKSSAKTGSHNTQRIECHNPCGESTRSKDEIFKNDDDFVPNDVDISPIPWYTDYEWDDEDDFVVDDLRKGDDFLANPQLEPKASSNDKVPTRRNKGQERPPSRPLNERSRREYTFIVGAGLGLSFNSGYINGCCLSGLFSPDGFLTQSVAAFTGTYTKAGLELAGGNTPSFVFELSMILCFVGGALISSLINPKAVPYQLGPTYGPTFIFGSVLLAVASALASINPNGKEIFLAAAANGMQNGMSSMYSGNLIRTTHLTGTSTDIGLFVGQMMRGNWTNAWKLRVLLGLAVSFWTGGLVSVYGMRTFRTYSLLLNSGFFFLIGCCLIAFLVSTHHITVWQAVSGTWVLKSVRSIRRRMSSSGISAMAKFGQCSGASGSSSSADVTDDELATNKRRQSNEGLTRSEGMNPINLGTLYTVQLSARLSPEDSPKKCFVNEEVKVKKIHVEDHARANCAELYASYKATRDLRLGGSYTGHCKNAVAKEKRNKSNEGIILEKNMEFSAGAGIRECLTTVGQESSRLNVHDVFTVSPNANCKREHRANSIDVPSFSPTTDDRSQASFTRRSWIV